MIGRFFSVYLNKKLIYFLTLFSSAFGVLLSSVALFNLPSDKILETSMPFMKINDFIINCGLHVDKISLIFALVLFLVSFLVQLFSISYMKNEKKSYRFFAFLNFFNFSMAGLFFSENLFQTYFFWEIAGLTSYLLIGFDYLKKEKSTASKKVFIINRIGDTAFIGALILCSYFIYAYAPNKNLATLSLVDLNTISTILYAYASSPIYEIICVMFMISALVKSAQFPFYTWLQDAMEAKLPVSALLHSATLVALGVYLTVRLLPFYTLEPVFLKLFVIIGIITAFICSLSACAQNHPKKALAYSTSAQLGLIFFAIGVLNIKAGLVLFIAHAFIKSLLFITLPRENEKWNYFNFIVFLISGLSLSGVIFSGLIAKEMLIFNLGNLDTILLSLLSFLCSFYLVRTALVVYATQGLKKERPNSIEMFSVLFLLILNIIFYIYLHKTAQYKITEPFWSALFGWIFAYVLYIKNAFYKVPVLYQLSQNGFYLDDFYTKSCSNFYLKFTDFCSFIEQTYLSNYSFIEKTIRFGITIFAFIENKVMNGVIRLIEKSFKRISLLDLKAQNSSIQAYNAYAFIIISLILLCVIIAYIIIFFLIGGLNG
ncbi:hypothetical protein IJ384_05090 [bacterium]|nr:hypothetical protein [bacterium]